MNRPGLTIIPPQADWANPREDLMLYNNPASLTTAEVNQ